MINLWISIGAFSLIVASIYVVNQIADIDSDRINHKLFLLPHKILSIRLAWILASLCAITGLLLSIKFGSILTLLFLASLILGYMYNLPPFRLKDRAIGGVVANALGHGMLTYLVGWYMAHIDQSMTTELFLKGIVSALAPSFANGAVFLATTIPDCEGDRSTGKKTYCVAYGEKRTAFTAAIFILCTLITSFFMHYNIWIMVIPSVISCFFFIYFAISPNRNGAFKAFKWPVFILSASVTLYVPEYALLIFLTFLGSRLYYKWRFGIEYPTFKSQ